MRNIISPLDGFPTPFGRRAFDPYQIGAYRPPLVLDFDDERYRSGGSYSYFSDALTHAASSNATMVDSDGLLKWRPHNLVSYSEQFDNAAWTKNNITVSADSTIAPDGTSTADSLFETTASNTFHNVRTSVSVVSGQTLTFSFYAKENTRQYAWFGVFSNDGAFGAGIVFRDSIVDLSTGLETGTTAGTLSYTFSSTNEGNGWYRYSISLQATTNSGTVVVSFGPAQGNSTYASYTGETDKSVYVWGAHVYRSDLGGMVDNPDRGDSYVPTTSSAVYLPRRGHHVYNGYDWVNEGLLHESEARTNLVPNSNTFSAATWANANVTVAQNVSGPDGNSLSAWTVTCTATTGEHKIGDTGLTTDETVTSTSSIFAKAGTARYLQASLEWGSNFAYAVFDLETGLVTHTNTAGTGVLSRALAEDFGDGWYRISVSGKIGTSASDALVWYISDTPTPATTATSFSANGTETIFIYGAQLEQNAPTPSSYIPTSGATATRAAETLTIPAANLPWPTPEVIGPELVTNGTFDTDTTGWTNNGMATFEVQSGRLRITANSNADSVYQDVTTTSGKVYLLTFDYDQVGGESLFDGTGIQWVSGSITGTGSISHVFIGTGSDRVEFVEGGPSNNADFYIDNISVREINPLAVSIQMDGRMTYADSSNGQEVQQIYWYKNSSENIRINLSTITTRTGEQQFTQTAASTLDSVVSGQTAYSPDILVPFNIASRHGSTFVNGAVDGVALTADTTPTALPDLETTDLNLGQTYMGTIRTFRMWADDLGDGGLEEATS